MALDESTHEAWVFQDDPFYWLRSRFRDKNKRTQYMESVLKSTPITSKIANEVKSKIRDVVRERFPNFHEFYPEIIISYSTGYRRDYDEVDGAGPGLMVVVALIDHLFEVGHPCYSDIMTPGGRDWRDYMLRLGEAKVMVFLLSRTALRSVFCLEEVAEAVNHGIQLIPLRLDETSDNGKDIANDEEAMWPDEELEKYAKGKNNAPNLLDNLKLRRFEARRELSRVASIPDYRTILKEPIAAEELVKRIDEQSVRGKLPANDGECAWRDGVEAYRVRDGPFKVPGEKNPWISPQHAPFYNCIGILLVIFLTILIKKILAHKRLKSIDVYVAMQAPSNVVDDLSERPHRVSTQKRLEREISTMEEARKYLRSIYLTDGRIHDMKVAFKKSSTVRVFVWCAEGIDELADKKKELSIEFLLELFSKYKVVPDVAVVCMTNGSRWVGEKLHHDLHIPNVVSISTNPFGNNCALLATAVIKFCAGILCTDDADDEPLKTLQRDVTDLDPCCECIPIPNVTEIPCFTVSGRDTEESAKLNIELKIQHCCTAGWFSPRELRNLMLDVADLPLVDDVKDYICTDHDGESICYHLKPYAALGLDKKETWDRARALALHVCNELEHDIRFRGSVHRVSSKEEAQRLQSALLEREGAALVWLDIVNEQSISIHSGMDWIGGFGEYVTLRILVTSVAQCFDEAEKLMQSFGSIGGSIELGELSNVDISTVRPNGVLSLLPFTQPDGSEASVLDRLRPTDLEFALQTLISKKCDENDRKKFFQRFFGIKIYRDDDKSTKLCMAVGDLTLLRKLLDLIFLREGPALFAASMRLNETNVIKFDCTDFASQFENIVLQLGTLTDHQRRALARVDGGAKYVRIEGGAGTGKTFVALQSTIDYLEGCKNGHVLFVCKNDSLAFYFGKWLYCRLRMDDKMLSRVFFLSQQSRKEKGFRYNRGNRAMEPIEDPSNPLLFGKIVIDEAHDVFGGHNGDGVDFRRELTQLLEQRKEKDCCLMLLSDYSQSSVPESEIEYPYPSKLTTIELTEVCRSTKRVTAGALSFQLGSWKNFSFAHESDGLPLPTYLFRTDDEKKGDKYHLYSQKIILALEDIVARFRFLNLHDRLAIIVPNEEFRQQLLEIGRLQMMFEDRKETLGQHLILKRAEDTSRALSLSSRGAPQERSWIVLDTTSAVAGLEWLIVLCVGLDEPLGEKKRNLKQVRARIYRAMTRGQFFVSLINEDIKGGWFEWISHLDGNAQEFDWENVLKTQNTAAAEMMSSQNVSGVPEYNENILTTTLQDSGKGVAQKTRDLEFPAGFRVSQDSRLVNPGIFANKNTPASQEMIRSPFVLCKFLDQYSYEASKDAKENDKLSKKETGFRTAEDEALLFQYDPCNWLCECFRDSFRRSQHMEEVLTNVPITSKIANAVKNKTLDRVRQEFPDFHRFYPEVIISFSTGYRKDYDYEDSAGPGLMVAAAVINFLFDNGNPCFSDIITPSGRDWLQYMFRLKQAKVLVFMLSRTSLRSVNCLLEAAEAIEAGVELIPVRCEETSLSGLDIARDTGSMWPDEELEKYVSINRNPRSVLDDLKVQRFQVTRALSGVSSLPDYGTILSEPTATYALLMRLRELMRR